jgi:phosphomannomutase
VRGRRRAVGFAQDPDADRLAIVDENGTYIGEEYSLALCAQVDLSQEAGGRR